ncbi:MAG: hypothetical protein ACM3NW_12050 [Syntrophomonadaceae bacterium]
MSPGGEGASRPGRETAQAALFFLALTVLMTWPQAAHLDDGLTDIWDAKLVARVLQWDFHQTLRDPLNLFQLNFFHPARYVLAFSENLWGVSLFGFPLLFLGGSPLLNYNVMLLLGMFLSALSAWALARHVTGDAIAAAVAGVVFAFLPWRFSQLPHMQFQWAAFLALTLLFLLRYLEQGRPRDAVLLGVAFAWNAFANVHYGIFGGLMVVFALGLCALAGVGDRRRQVFALVAVVLGGLCFLPFALAYRRAEALYGMRRYYSEMLFYSGRWSYFLSAGEKNRLWGPVTKAWRGPEGDFFPGLAALVLAAVALMGVRVPPEAVALPGPPVSAARRRLARAVDVLILLAAAVWLLASFRPGLRAGRISIGDPGRPFVWLTAFVVLRLSIAFPRGRRHVSLGDWLRRTRMPFLLTLFSAVAVLGVGIALGGNTPYYRFLFSTFGTVFHAIRAPSRGIAIFDLALAVLAAWGLAILVRGRPPGTRLMGTAAAVVLLGVEYRASPLGLYPETAEAPPVYRWLAAQHPRGAVVEWPLGVLYDQDYVFRQSHHEKPLVNGYSGFFPPAYQRLEADLKRRPIPESVWKEMGELGAVLLVYHSHETRGVQVSAYADALEKAVASGGLALVESFPHGSGLDFVFVSAREEKVGPAPERARRLFEQAVEHVREEGMRLAPPFGSLDSPAEGGTVTSRAWGFGWALDDSGIAEVRVRTDDGSESQALLHMRHRGLGAGYPDYEDAENGGFGFFLPDLSPGPHRLTVTFVAKDGGTTSIERTIRVVSSPAAAPTPRGAEGGPR